MPAKKKLFIALGVAFVLIMIGSATALKLKGYSISSGVAELTGSIKYCDQAGEYLQKNYALKFSVPADFCFISSSVAENGTYLAQVVPHDVQLGSVVESVEAQRAITSKVARVTVMVEPETPGRIQNIVSNLSRSGGLGKAEITNVTNPFGVRYMKLHNVASSDTDGLHYYDMALIEHQSGNYLISVISPRPTDPTVFDYMLNRISVLK